MSLAEELENAAFASKAYPADITLKRIPLVVKERVFLNKPSIHGL